MRAALAWFVGFGVIDRMASGEEQRGDLLRLMAHGAATLVVLIPPVALVIGTLAAVLSPE